MKLKTLAKIEYIIRMVLILLAFPFWIIEMILITIRIPFSKVTNKLAILANCIGNRLLRCSNEVKNQTIKNEYCIRNYTARFALKKLNEEQI